MNRSRSPEEAKDAAMATKLAAAAKKEADASERVDELLREAREQTTLTWAQIGKALGVEDQVVGVGDDRAARRLISKARWRYYSQAVPLEESWPYLRDQKEGRPRRSVAEAPSGALTKKDAAELIGVSRVTLDAWIKKGEITTTTVGKRVYVQCDVGDGGALTLTYPTPRRQGPRRDPDDTIRIHVAPRERKARPGPDKP